jgi:hypothetical protein
MLSAFCVMAKSDTLSRLESALNLTLILSVTLSKCIWRMRLLFIQMYIILFTKCRYWTLSWTSRLQLIYSHHYHFYVALTNHLFSDYFHSNVDMFNLSCVTSYPVHLTLPNNIKLRDWVMKLSAKACPPQSSLCYCCTLLITLLMSDKISPTVTCKFFYSYQTRCKITAYIYIYIYNFYWATVGMIFHNNRKGSLKKTTRMFKSGQSNSLFENTTCHSYVIFILFLYTQWMKLIHEVTILSVRPYVLCLNYLVQI